MNDITAGRPTNFGQDQITYSWNGIRHCVHCHSITQKGDCPNGCELFIGTWGQALSGDTNSARFEAALEAEAKEKARAQLLTDEAGFRICNRCNGRIEGGTLFSLEDTDEGPQIFCNHCTDERTDEKLAAGTLKISEDGTIFCPKLFPGKVATKPCLSCGARVPEARVVSKCNECIDQAIVTKYNGIRSIEIWFGSGEIDLLYCDGHQETIQIDESEEPRVTEFIQGVEGQIRYEGSQIIFFAQFDYSDPDPWLAGWVAWGVEPTDPEERDRWATHFNDGPSGISGYDQADLAKRAEQINDVYDEGR